MHSLMLDALAAADGTQVVSTDVFDTLLLRDQTSERRRMQLAERRFSSMLRDQGILLDPETLMRTRLQVQRMSFRALNVGGCGEVRLSDIVERQLAALSLPGALATQRINIEFEIETKCLRPSGSVAEFLRRQRLAGKRIVAVSDTTWSGDMLSRLIEHFHGPGLLDQVYTSADLGKTKRQGDIFEDVARREGVDPGSIFHIGDDAHSDGDIPRAFGVKSFHLPRSSLRGTLRRLNGATVEVARRMAWSPRESAGAGTKSARDFGREVLGPVATEFCLQLWFYASQAESGKTCALLFCARGGIGIRAVFEETLSALGLKLDAVRQNFLVSRLVAARVAVESHSNAALEELAREFRTNTFEEVALALAGRRHELPQEWKQRFDPERFYALLDSPSGRGVLADIVHQNVLFERHLSEVSGKADRLILVDTGLYGSTQRLLSAGLPHLSFETVQFARANYKGHGEEHFPRVTGCVVEQNFYNPLQPETCVLRYWHLVERLFEPAIPSVRMFHETEEGDVAANSGSIVHGAIDPAIGNDLLAGVVDYAKALRGSRPGAVASDAENAWSRLRQAVVWPSPADVRLLGAGSRSVDFGRSGAVQIVAASDAAGLSGRLRRLRSHLWREGAVVDEFPNLKPALLAAIESAHALRGLSALLRA